MLLIPDCTLNFNFYVDNLFFEIVAIEYILKNPKTFDTMDEIFLGGKKCQKTFLYKKLNKFIVA